MNSDPKRLTVVGATELERTLLQAARRERPSPELTARMAAGLGISVGLASAAGSASAAQAAGAGPAAVAAPAAVGKTAVGAWLTAGVLAAAIGAGVVGGRLYGGKRGDEAARSAPAVVAPPVEERPAAPRAPSAASGDSGKRAERAHRRAFAPAAPAADLRDQIALIDAARTAVRAGATDKALALLRRYDASYAGGAFRPEALALRVEALDQAGRGAEAQALAREFLARYPQSPVAERIARVARK